jgi:hypothetical protein
MLRKVVFLLATFTMAAAAQDPRGAILGRVTDASDAVIPGVVVRATNLETNVITRTTSNEHGNYELPYLLPGAYKVEAELSGFKTWARGAVEVRMGDRVRIDIQMAVGAVAERVEVTAAAPLIESATGAIALVMTTRQISDLPLRSGSLSSLYAMAPGVVQQTLPYDGPWNVIQASEVSAGGGAKNFDFNVDGVGNNSYAGNSAFTPPQDMVQEVRIETGSFDAAVGHTSGGAVNVTLKTGTNALRGSLGASASSGPMMTRNFFTNRFIFDPTTGPITDAKIKANTPSTRWVRYSAAVGGPVYIPKIYDGRNKTFWMFGFQKHDRRRPVATTHSVPTAAERGGDFSALLAGGAQYQIYDPFTTRREGTTRFRRDALLGNIIPAARTDATARKILGYYPLPNVAGTPDGTNNYVRTRQDTQKLSQPMARIDHNFSEKNRMFARYSHSDFRGSFDELVAGSKVRGRFRERPHRGLALDDVLMLSPRTLLDLRYGFTWFSEYQTFANMGWNLGEFGLPSGLIAQLNPAAVSFPVVNVSGLLQLGNDGGFQQVYYSHSLLGVLNRTHGNHSLKAGGDLRLLRNDAYTYGNVSPSYTFGDTYTRGPLDNATGAPQGQSLASFMFGIPTGGGADTNDSRAESGKFYAGFLQDDWRLSRKLTVNLGLRWEYESPPMERYDRAVRDFDFSTPNPIQAQAQAQYARAPIAQVPAAQFRTLGGITFVGRGGNPRSIRDPYRKGFMPRFGFAYQLKPRAVIRGGYGIYYGLLGAEYTDVAQPGFNQTTNIVSSLDNGMTYIASISNPLPAGLEKPKGAAAGLETFVGRSPEFYASDGRRPYTQRWSYSIQVQPFAQSVLEIGYLGSRSVRLRAASEFNAVPRQYLSTLPVRDQAVYSTLSAQVSNPFFGIPALAGSTLNTANTTVSQLVRPYPQFINLTTGLPAGSSWYHALAVRFERRFHRGFQLQGSYTWSKTMEAVEYLNATDSAPTHVVSAIDRPHRVVITGIYDLPFGAGRRFARSAHGILNHVIGGWQANAIFQVQSGPPLGFANVIYTGTYSGLKLSGDARSIDRWFNTDGFNKVTAQQLVNNIRAFPLRIGAARSDGMNLWDLSAHKNFRLREGLRLQLRGEAEGAMNHPNFGVPNTVPTNQAFGKVTQTQTQQEERRIFAGLKLLF